MGYKIDEVEGIGPAYRQKLAAAGIVSTDDLLSKCSSAKGRQAIADSTGVSEKLLLNWSNKADLMRISGVGPQFAELLEAAGVDTIKELRHRKAENLAGKMSEVNQIKKLSRTSPAQTVIEKWISQAKSLEPKISH